MQLKLLRLTVDEKTIENVGDYFSDGILKAPAYAPVSKIRLDFAFSYSAKAIVLGDAWERGYGDLAWERPDALKNYPWYISVRDGEVNTLFGVKTGPNAFCHWKLAEGRVSLCADVRCGAFPVIPQEDFTVCEIVTMQADSKDLFANLKAFTKRMCEKPVLPDSPVYGGNNWYYAYGKSSAEEIVKDTQLIARWAQGLKNRPYMVIDACWQPFMLNDECSAGGPYPHGNYLFRDMADLARRMRDMDVLPGLWYRPLKTAESLPDHFFIDKMILDPTVPEVFELLKDDARRLSGWGYKLLKHDFSTYDLLGFWGFDLAEGIRYKTGYAFHDRSCTTAMAVKRLYQAIYEGASENGALIIACNTVSHLAAGLAHIQRTGDDTSGMEWARTRKMGVNTMAFRLPQHNTFYAADADCIGITSSISWDRNAQWLRLLAESGTPLFVSADPKAMDAEKEKAVAAAFSTAAAASASAIPLDWETCITPAHWQTKDGEISFDWR